VLLIEQNLGVALDVADNIGVMVNGRIAPHDAGRATGRRPRTAGAAAGRALRRPRRRSGSDRARPAAQPTMARPRRRCFTVRRAHADGAPSLDDIAPRTVRGFNRWNAAAPRRR
jgi:ABC-type dipeptide/oligopeptide/nickel transport system ATPase component